MDKEKKTLGLFESFELPNGNTVRFKKPTVGDIEKSNVMASEYAKQLLAEGKLMVRQEIQAILDSKTDSADIVRERIQASFNKMKELSEKYDKVEDPQQKEKIMLEVQKMQMGVIDGLTNTLEIYNHSVESQVDKYRKMALMQLSTLKEDGSLYWPTMQALENEDDIGAYNVIALRFSEIQGSIALTDEQRYQMHELLKAEGASLNLEAVTSESAI